jgi:hypothetical protein
MRDAAPGLIAKIGVYKPLVVCFVGKIIWDHVEAYLVQVSKEKGKRPRKQPFSYDLQPYKLVYPEDVLNGSSTQFLHSNNHDKQRDGQGQPERRYSFVVPSTSARVVGYDVSSESYSLPAL